MRLDQPIGWLRTLDPWTRAALLVWTVVLFAVGIRCGGAPRDRTLYPTWATAGADWWAGSDKLYRRTGQDGVLDTFRYTPFVAATLVPWSFLGERIGGVLWRLSSAGVFLGAAWWWLRSAAPGSLTPTQRGCYFLLLLPLSLTSLGNGQVNPLVIGFLLAALAAASEDRRWLAGAFVALATSIKLYPVVIGLLLVACFPRRFVVPLLCALVAVAGLPFVLQQPAFVLAEYRQWLSLLGLDEARKDWPPHMAYRDLWLLLHWVWEVPVTKHGYLALQVLGGALVALVCVVGRLRGQPVRHVLNSILTLGCCWMMLLGPATESATYIMLAPPLAWALVADRGFGRAFTVAGACLLLACVLAGLFHGTAQFHGRGWHPLGTLLFFVGSMIVALQRPVLASETVREPHGIPLAA